MLEIKRVQRADACERPSAPSQTIGQETDEDEEAYESDTSLTSLITSNQNIQKVTAVETGSQAASSCFHHLVHYHHHHHLHLRHHHLHIYLPDLYFNLER